MVDMTWPEALPNDDKTTTTNPPSPTPLGPPAHASLPSDGNTITTTALVQAHAHAMMQRLLPLSPSFSPSDPTTTNNNNNEAAAWAALRPLQKETAALAGLLNGYNRPLSVPAFLRACRGGEEGEGERRVAALRLVMRPLLHDVFAVKSLEEVLSCLRWGPREV